MLLRIIALLSLLFVLSGCAEPPYTNIDNTQLQTLLKQGVTIYDVRRPEEWRQTGVVEGSRLLTFVDANGRPTPDFFARFTTEVKKDEPVIVICRTGNRTDVLARLLVEELGYRQVYNVRDGITRWIAEKNPTVRK
ncbi:MAG: rhodanese-like domain-containing protein [Hydrogenophilaceae bacterium]|nr:rhodanese-like domain-containing protein [Hydrogenophilaceae bacterium]